MTSNSNFVKVLMAIALLTLVGCGSGNNIPPDTDGDGVEDTLDWAPNDPAESADTDEDGVGDNGDTCPEVANTEQTDTDGDGAGDACDDDQDGDELLNADDNCPLNANADQADADVNGEGDACDPMPTTYAFINTYFSSDENSSVNYDNQTAEQVLISDMTYYMATMLSDDGTKTEDTVKADLNFFVYGADGEINKAPLIGTYIADAANVSLKDADTYGDIAVDSSLYKKIAGGCGSDCGEVLALIDGEFFGWNRSDSEGNLITTPLMLVDDWIATQAIMASDGEAVQITDAEGVISSANVNTDAHGRNYGSLITNFLMGAVNFSQATNDYFINDFGSQLSTDGGDSPNNFSESEHAFDQGFGYYGAARDNLDYTDLEVQAESGREGWQYGYHDTDADDMIDLRGEYNFTYAKNCAELDVGSSAGPTPTDFSSEIMNSVIAARQIISNAANKATPDLSEAENTKLQDHIKMASVVWEKCIAASAIHHVNGVIAGVGEYTGGAPASLDNFEMVAKHWSDLKGLALTLQFSPASPFRDAEASVNLDDLKIILQNIGDAPVLADGSQNGIATTGTAADAAYAYVGKLVFAREILQEAYGFSDANTLAWQAFGFGSSNTVIKGLTQVGPFCTLKA